MITISSLQSCYYDKEDQLYPNSNYVDTNAVITFAANVKPIFDTKCATSGCHTNGGQSPNLSTYTGISSNIARVKVRAIDLKTMPSSGPLGANEIAILTKWINSGYPNN